MKKFSRRGKAALIPLITFSLGAAQLFSAHAQVGNNTPPPPLVNGIPLTSPADVNIRILCPLFNTMFIILIVLSGIVAIVAGYLYLISGGDSEKVRKATKTLSYAAVGILVALFAKGFPIFVASIFNVGGLTVC